MSAPSERPHFQQAVYDEGHKDGRRTGFKAGEDFGRTMQKMEDGNRLPMGIGIGAVIGAVIQPVVFWIKGVCW